jgi:DNA-binding NtrC family response regulator
VWHALTHSDREAVMARLGARATAVARAARERLANGERATAQELEQYEAIAFYALYDWARPHLEQIILDGPNHPAEPRAAGGGGAAAPAKSRPSRRMDVYDEFVRHVDFFLGVDGLRLPAPAPTPADAPHLFACYYQILRAFYHTFANLVGRSAAIARLRAAVWESIFTHDLRRYFRVLYARMGDLTTLVTGGSGTGKELVARAIGLSRYIPFDPKSRTFAEDEPARLFHPLNLSALSPTLIESELFGHRRGAFTGALEDRAGWLETCPPLGTVFLDEIGELDPLIQVKLLRVLQSRTFQRLGDTTTRQFRGKIIAATNRDLSAELAQGAFRKDFYYRLCSDLVSTPSLREQLGESPDELHDLILFIARRTTGDGRESTRLADEVETWVKKHLGRDYPWPGNFRELEQCVRNVMIRREYRPPAAPRVNEADRLAGDLQAGALTAEELVRRYCSLVYSQTRNYEETARRLGLDRRTVKAKVTARANGANGANGADGACGADEPPLKP